jgi:hypothetical protein
VQKAPSGRLLHNGPAAPPHVARRTPSGRPSHNMRLDEIPKKIFGFAEDFSRDFVKPPGRYAPPSPVQWSAASSLAHRCTAASMMAVLPRWEVCSAISSSAASVSFDGFIWILIFAIFFFGRIL